MVRLQLPIPALNGVRASFAVAQGQQYNASIRPCATLLVVGLSATEAKVEAICDEFCELTEKRSMMQHMSGKLIKGTISREDCRARNKEYDHDSGALGQSTRLLLLPA